MINHFLQTWHIFLFTVALTKRSQYYSQHPSQKEFTTFRKIFTPSKGLSTTTTSEDTDREFDQSLIVVKIKENFWNMLKQLSSQKTHENEKEKYVTNTKKNKYFRVAWVTNTYLNQLLILLSMNIVVD